MKKTALLILFTVSSLLFFTIIKNKNKVNLLPIDITKEHICSADSMILLNYNGPKAQIIWSDGTISFYCEVKEAFYEYLNPVKSKRILKFFVQDFSNVEWGSYNNLWCEAENLFYVIDSKKSGAMGLTYVPFTNLQSAESFKKIFSGKLIKFQDIDTEILRNSSMLSQNNFME